MRRKVIPVLGACGLVLVLSALALAQEGLPGGPQWL